MGMFEIKTKKASFAICALIGLSFLWTGSEYMTWWLYKLPLHFDNTAIDLWSEVAGYLFQVAGILLFALAIKKKPKIMNRNSFLIIVLADGLAATAAYFAGNADTVLLFGMLMNLLHGMIGGYYLTRLTQLVPQQNRGLVFAIAYAFGSVGSWALSLFMQGTFLGSPYVFVAYAAMMTGMIAIDRISLADDSSDLEAAETPHFDKLIIPLAAVVVVLLSVVKGLGFYFPSGDLSGGVIRAETTRAFYAVGLIAAGFLNDRNRKHGAICCLCALIFPFLTFALRGEPDTGTVMWISGYIFFGFFSVYRVVTFSDLAGKKDNLLYIAGFGLMFGRIGDALGALIGISMCNTAITLIWLSAALLLLTFVVFFWYYNKVYASLPVQDISIEDRIHEFEKAYNMTDRESEVFELIVAGRSNAEIAADLYVSENTVKFHVRNVLKKTACPNRTELTAEFRKTILC